MMPSKFRVTSAAAAGLVGLVVTGLILFGTDPLGMATTTIGVPAPAAAAASRTPAEANSQPDDHSLLKAGRHHRPRPHLTKSARPRTHYSYRPRPRHTVPHPRFTGWPRPTHSPSVQPTATATTTNARPTVTPTATSSTTTSTRPSVTPTSSPTRSTSTPTATAPPTVTAPAGQYAVRADWAAAVLSALNSERAEHGLPALSSNAKLVASAHRHNVAMANANQLSHQLSGEPGLGARISAAGYSWSSVGENIAYNSNRSEAGVLALQQAMYNETPPDDGHRRNILSSSFTEVGVDVIDDPGHRKVWLVTDFGRP